MWNYFDIKHLHIKIYTGFIFTSRHFEPWISVGVGSPETLADVAATVRKGVSLEI